MKVVATKRAHPTSEYLGYLQAILVETELGWELADEQNLPDTAEVFVHAKYTEGVDKKFHQNELIICEPSENEGATSGNCIYSVIGTECRPVTFEDDLFAILELTEKLENKEHYNVRSAIKPPTFCFMRIVSDTDEEAIIGPFNRLRADFNEVEKIWESRLGLVGGQNRSFHDLQPYHVYFIPVSNLPDNTIHEGVRPHAKNKKLASGLASFLRNVPVDQRALITDGTLIRVLDDAINKTSKLGRKGRRDTVAKIEASKELNDTMKPALLSLFSRMDEQEDENKKVLADVFDQFKVIHNPGSVQDEKRTDELNKKITKLEEDLKISNDKRRDAERQTKDLTIEQYEKSVQHSDEMEKENKALKTELEVFRSQEQKELDICDLDKRKAELEFGVNSLHESETGLTETVARLKSELALTTSQFREKALSVLPFLEIMNNVKSDAPQGNEPELKNIYEPFIPVTLSELIKTLSSRVEIQGYIAESVWLDLVSALYLSNKFIGFFGSPGTGKTTLAKCFNNALGREELNCEVIKVGRGWSSFSDFVGFDNSFTGNFKYKNIFYKKFEKNNLGDNSFYSLMFDEATLSSPEFYLSDFLTETDLSYNSDCEKINLDGHNIYLPIDTRFVLTFNVDETTEQLSERLISRMPIVYLSHNEIEPFINIEYKNFPPIDKTNSDQLVASRIKETPEYEILVQEYDARYPNWKKILPEKLTTRKNNQILKFLSIAAHLEEVDATLVIDFVEEVFLLPHVKGDGIEYRESLDELLAKPILASNVKRRLAQIIEHGEKYNIFRHA